MSINEEIDLTAINIEATVTSGANVESSISSGMDVTSVGVGGPQGLQGEQGDKGDKCDKGDKGDTGSTGPAGPANTLSIGAVTGGETADATITGASPNQTLNLTLPKGDAGTPGQAATIAVGTVSTGAPGSSVTVTNSGTSSAAVFDFSIPQGVPGSYTAGNAINITSDTINAHIYPDDFFTDDGKTSGAGTSFALDNTIELPALTDVQLKGDTTQQASPNPDYPQTVNVVTGEQTVTVGDGDSNSDTYIVDLGSIELCKIGTYQDKIYKSGGNWYVHKETGRVVFDGSESWTRSTYSSTNNFYTPVADALEDASFINTRSDMFSPTPLLWGSLGNEVYGIALYDTAPQIRILYPQSLISDADAFKTWLSTHNTTVYYALATPTDTQITDANLIAQLKALAGAGCYAGQTNFAVTATELPGVLAVEADSKSLAGLIDFCRRSKHKIQHTSWGAYHDL